MLGAREHYAPVIMAERAGWLDCFVTDYWATRGRSVESFAAKLGCSLADRALARFTPEIPLHKVRALCYLGLRYKWMLARTKDRARQYAVFEQFGAQFAREACQFVTPLHDVFFGFSGTSLETLHHAAKLGVRSVLDQIDPSRSEYDLVAEEERRFPRIAAPAPVPPASYFDRIRCEWEAASIVLVNSEWSKLGLIRQGVPAQKISIAPLGYETATHVRLRDRWKKELKVLWIGTLCLRKGLPYAIEAAEELVGSPVRFTFAGPCDLQLSSLRFPRNANYVGAVPHAAASQLYGEHDLFIFPTLSDGFGLTQIEAMAHGLPVISTGCCGDVVEHQKSGIRIPPRDARALADSIRRFIDEPDLLTAMSSRALDRSLDFSPEAVWPRYAEAIRTALAYAA